MSSPAEEHFPRTLEDLLDVHAIQRLKFKYFRCIDRKLWHELRECLADEATATYGGGSTQLEGADAIVKYLVGALGSEQILTSHAGSSPEIDLVGTDNAIGTWALQDIVIHQQYGVTIQGASFYKDRYVKRGGRWLISSTTYTRTYEEIWPRASVEGLKLTADFWATGGRSSLG